LTPVDRERLENEAYTVADLHRAGRLTREDALRELARACPGFTREEYERAFAQGLFESR
jgi:hypothetical protein